MSWNYRIIKRIPEQGEPYYGIFEVYYDKYRNIKAWTTEPVTPVWEDIEDLKGSLELMLRAFEKDVLDENKIEIKHEKE